MCKIDKYIKSGKKEKEVTMKRKGLVLMLLSVMMFCFIAAGGAQAEAIILTDGNSSAVIDPTSQFGMSSWTVDNVDLMYQQWFWYRVGGSAELPVNQYSIDTISTPVVTQNTSNSASIVYTANAFTLGVTYTLLGGQPGSGTADIAETIRINNTSRSALDFHFFQYSDFDLAPNFTYDAAKFVSTQTVDQWNTVGGQFITETGVVSLPNHREINYFANTVNALNSTKNLVLADTPVGVVVGPGDMEWAFQWDKSIPAGGTFIISKDKNIFSAVPEPGTLLLLGCGLIGLVALRKRIKKH
jgi:large repetitive protein